MPVSGPRLLTETRIWRDVIGVLPAFTRKFFARFQSRFVALFIGVSLSELRTSVTALLDARVYVCMSACGHIPKI